MRSNPVWITVLLVVTASLLYFANYLNTFSPLTAINIKPLDNHDFVPNEISVDSFFLYRAYVYDSANRTSIRVLSINRCIKPDLKLTGVINKSVVRLRAQPIEGSCPWTWARGCLYSSYVLDTSLRNNTDSVNQITLYRGENMLSLSLQRIQTRKTGALNVCVPPIYWKVFLIFSFYVILRSSFPKADIERG
ncbi:hypothetical protein KIN20_011473 [Parelaphostrongylus tenuis]|uniref:Uncharacterized protein n=1 Tax=Parelaphostrongylus tenuis TaxID=148309 RepID=A0AAD5MTN4_PARTN|nr:hypothetical protein KIN20_011473 [Parelaphostrongylus tenuis]